VEYVNESDILYAMEKGVSLYSINLESENNINEQEKEKDLKGK
jgi:hypothetical protein